MDALSAPGPSAFAFQLKDDPRVLAARPPSAYMQLVAAYERDLAGEPQLADWTLAAIEARLRAEPSLEHRQRRVHHSRARLLRLFLTKPKWMMSELLVATGLKYNPVYNAGRPLRELGLLHIRRGGQEGSTVELTAAGEAWLLELVEPGTLG